MKVKCAYPECSGRRKHWQNPDEPRQHQTIELTEEQYIKYNGIAYCSIECQLYHKAMKEQNNQSGTLDLDTVSSVHKETSGANR